MLELHFIELGMAYLLAAMMPGPSIALIIRNGILYSRMASTNAALGIIAANALQSGVVLLGLIFLDNNSIFLKTFKILCSLYLIYLGLKILLGKKVEIVGSNEPITTIKSLKNWNYFLEGFLVDFLNPLAFTFFVSIMAIIISPQETWGIKIGYWIEIIFISIVWFYGVALISSFKKINYYFKRYHKILEIIAGIVFILFGSKMFF